LRFAAECGDYLVVGVLSDQLAANAQLSQDMRLEGVQRSVGSIMRSCCGTLREKPDCELRPVMVVKGKEHENGINRSLASFQSYGGKLLFGSGDTTFSSLSSFARKTELIKNHARFVRPREFVEGTVSAFRPGVRPGADALTQGMRDRRSIVDDYIQCDPLGMSQEDPTIVVTPIMTDRFIGGRAIFAAHARHLGARSVNFSR